MERKDSLPQPPANAVDLAQAIRTHFDDLSRQLKLVARYVESNGDRLALEGIQETALQCGVHPSAVVRFAKRFGFKGFSEMQALFRVGAAQRLAPGTAYQARIRSLIDAESAPISNARITQEVINGSIHSLEALREGTSLKDIDKAVALMQDAKAIWLVAARRSFPVGAYLAYALQQTERPIHWLHGLGHMQQGEMRAMDKDDVVIAISFDPYAEETLDVVNSALARKARLLAITDSRLSPVATHAEAVLLVQESGTFGFRSLTSTMCVAQALFLSLAYRMEMAGPLAQGSGGGKKRKGAVG